MKILILILLIMNINHSIANDRMQLGEKMDKYMDLNESDLINLEKLANNNNFKAAVRVGNYYSFIKRDSDKALKWFTKASELGSFVGMLRVAFKFEEGVTNVKSLNDYLMLMTSLGVNQGKELYLKLCKSQLICDYPVFYQQVELTISDSSEFSYLFMCLVRDEIQTLNSYQLSVTKALSKVFSDDFKEKSLCGDDFFGDEIQSLVSQKSNEYLVKHIEDWLMFFAFEEKINTRKLANQENWLINYTNKDTVLEIKY